MKTLACFVPFDLFGSAGTRTGAELLADAFQELLADNRHEPKPTRSRAYMPHVRMRSVEFETIADYANWKSRARRVARQTLHKEDFLLWVTGNHLGVLPVLEELGPETLVVQLDAHLDIYHLSDCTTELSHGNYLLHAEKPLPRLVNVGSREQILPPEHIRNYYQATFPAAEMILRPERVLGQLRKLAQTAPRVFLDIDCDVWDPADFPAVTHPEPFGLRSSDVLRVLDACWGPQVVGIALSEFDPAHDCRDRSLATLLWLVEYLLLKRHEQ